MKTAWGTSAFARLLGARAKKYSKSALSELPSGGYRAGLRIEGPGLQKGGVWVIGHKTEL